LHTSPLAAALAPVDAAKLASMTAIKATSALGTPTRARIFTLPPLESRIATDLDTKGRT
jgi:hypothetical protein